MKIDLTGNVALVTGAAGGIGFGIVRVLCAAGAHVVLNDLRREAGAAAVATLKEAGSSVEFVCADVSDESAVASLVAEIGARHGALQLVVNNAGIAFFGGITVTSPADWDRVMAVDSRAIYLVTRACLPLLKSGAPSAVVNVASVHASATVATMTAYAAAKGSVVSMTRSLAQELGPLGIRVNVISPGFVMTPLFEDWLAREPDPGDSLRRINETIPMRRIATIEDVGNLVAFLASDKAVSIAGANFHIDGGLTARLMH